MFWKFIFGLLLAFGVYFFQKLPYANEPVTSSTNGPQRLIPPDVEIPQPPTRSLLQIYKNAAVCSDKMACSEIGSSIMQQGGNAVDSVIATLLCNGLVTMQSMGLGGGVLMTYYSQEQQQAFHINGRERAASQILADTFRNLKTTKQLAESVNAIGVPGEIAAYHEAHRLYGSLKWLTLLKPTIDLCHKGYRLTRHQRDSLFLNEQRIREDKLLRKMFINSPTKKFYREGSHIILPKELCRSYEILAEEGPLTFYNGSLAKLIALDLQDMKSIISVDDLQSYRAESKPALQWEFGDFFVFLPQPPGSGHVLAFIMNILQRFKADFKEKSDFDAVDVHRIVEALKFGFVKRWAFDTTVDVETLDDLLSLDFAKNSSWQINDLKAFDNPHHYGAKMELLARADHGTAHISVIDGKGNAVSATSSINYYFGSGRMGKRTGILFNNALSDFSIEQLPNYFSLPNVKDRNNIKPHKQPMSSMIPLIVTHKVSGHVRLALGAAGGSRIISTLVQILIRTLWLQQNIKQAIDAPRFHHQLLPNTLEYEFGALSQIIDDLKASGHRTERIRGSNTAVCGIEKVKNILLANADFRKEGAVDGF